ncbi:MAG TPA: hypothetical protein VGF58_02000 [Burkholderiales bacterium]|jgi:hypothetical protein
MTLSDLGNLGQFISSIFVAISLVYLAIQIRQGSKIARASLRQALAENQFAQLTLRATDPVIRMAFRKASHSEDLTEDEADALLAYAVAGIRQWEALYSQYERGMVDAEDWRSTRQVMVQRFRLPIFQQAFDSLAPDRLNPIFLREVSQLVAQAQKTLPR